MRHFENKNGSEYLSYSKEVLDFIIIYNSTGVTFKDIVMFLLSYHPV